MTLCKRLVKFSTTGIAECTRLFAGITARSAWSETAFTRDNFIFCSERHGLTGGVCLHLTHKEEAKLRACSNSGDARF